MFGEFEINEFVVGVWTIDGGGYNADYCLMISLGRKTLFPESHRVDIRGRVS